MSFTVPSNEPERLRTLHDLHLLDTPREVAFDDLCAEAARAFDAPVALITLLDRDRQWFKAEHGFGRCESPRGTSFCNHVAVNADVLIVPDARADPRFRDNPLVTGPPHLRFYAGAPLYYGDGIVLGALCILDPAPRAAETVAIDRLRHLADQVAGEIWVRQALQAAEGGVDA